MSSDEDMIEDDDDETLSEYNPDSSRLASISPPPSNRPLASSGHKGKDKIQGKRRGRKPHPNPLVRTAREAARRANHSVIEKKRREKINAALAELRELVPNEEGSAIAGVKEFKLEVLVRTVSHLKSLIARVESLEQTQSLPALERNEERLPGERVTLPPISSFLPASENVRSNPQLLSPPLSGSLSQSGVTSTPLFPLVLPAPMTSNKRSSHAEAAELLLHMSTSPTDAFPPVSRLTGKAQTPGALLGLTRGQAA